MGRYILSPGLGEPSNEELARMKRWKSLRVLDETSRMMLVDMDPEEIELWKVAYSEWSAEPDQEFPLPSRPDKPLP